MRKRILRLAVIGFLIGVAADFIVPSVINGVPLGTWVSPEELVARVGNPTAAKLLSFLVIGLFGAACMVGTLFYEIERWPLALATAAHYLTISLGYLIPARLLCWNLPAKLLLRIEGVMTLGFFLIWLIMYCIYRRQVRELNRLRERMESGQADEKKENQTICLKQEERP
jgi:hypothetical protein